MRERHRWRDLGELDDDPFVADDPFESEGVAEGADEGVSALSPAPPSGAGPRAPSWKQYLAAVQATMERPGPSAPDGWRPGREVLYVVDVAATIQEQGLTVEVAYRDGRMKGGWTKVRALNVRRHQLGALPDPADRQVLALLAGARDPNERWSSYYPSYDTAPHRYRLPALIQDTVIPLMCRTGRCCLRLSRQDEALSTLEWDASGPWEFWLEVRRHPATEHYVVTGSLRRGEERMDLSVPALLVAGGLVFCRDRVAPLDDRGAFPWIGQLRGGSPLTVPAKHRDEVLERLLRGPRVPRLDLPEELRYEEVSATPRPRLRVRTGPREWGPDRLRGELSFDYEGAVVPAGQPGRGIFQRERRRFTVRDLAVERAAAERLGRLGFRPRVLYRGYGSQTELALASRHLPRVVPQLLQDGWHVEAEGRLYRRPGALQIEVTSGVDWFELRGTVEFGNTTARLPELLAALRRGENTVRLGDGSFGMLPEDWLRKYGMLAGLGTVRDGHLRFGRSQVGVLDALLAAHPEASCDAVFARAREELRRFDRIEPRDPPEEFVGLLRGYQRDGLGWLLFLQRFGFGGCLADDMGLGKTVQVLALLESRRQQRGRALEGGDGRATVPGPSLVVVPRSLVFNWKQEAARFTPKLSVLDHTGVGRARASDHFDAYDLVVTTYGTLRRDAIHFRDVRFDYVILDEAQAIKNAGTESAKAARLLRGDHRLVLSGTPVENHLGELWSLFEFLNPGMLGTASAFGFEGVNARNPAPETRSLLARALRPFVLRRTKGQVARDLPPKVEQTLYCELDSVQRGWYDELREHYRHALLGRIAQDGLGRSKIQILEALLRLRQAACHPGLIDRSRVDEPSAKLDVLLPQLAEVLAEGHKGLVFSQFTSLLAIVRARLDRDGIPYEYLDGRTRDRAARVERFQRDPECRLFLVSLKAGGLGLNLTAADYVFLLDPWWNPAVEAQAIDRTHRIGQSRPVFAYRLIARDTVEEKVLELQEGKRALADAIIRADDSLIRSLTREDLELLLS